MTSFWQALGTDQLTVTIDAIDGVSTRVLELGDQDSEPLVFLHGVGGHVEAFAYNLRFFATDYRVIAYDFPGHGHSDGPADRSYEIDGYVDHLRDLLKMKGANRASLIGLSLGGWVAARAACDYPELIERLILVAPGGATFDREVMRSITELSRKAVQSPDHGTVQARLEWLMADPNVVTDELVDSRYSIYTGEGYVESMERVLCLQDPDTRRRNLLTESDWAAIAQPSLVCWGTADATAPASKGAEIAEMMGNARFESLTGLGHWPQYESPSVFNEMAIGFLSSTSHSDSS